MVKLVNSAMMPQPGRYVMTRLSKDAFVDNVVEAFWLHQLESFIGYQTTADHIKRISGVNVQVNRAEVTLTYGDVMLVCRLKYRLADPSAKKDAKAQAEISDNDFEYFFIVYDEV